MRCRLPAPADPGARSRASGTGSDVASSWLPLALGSLGLVLVFVGFAFPLRRPRRSPRTRWHPNPVPIRRLWAGSYVAFGVAMLVRALGELDLEPGQQWMRDLASTEFLCLCAAGTALGLRANRLRRVRTCQFGGVDDVASRGRSDPEHGSGSRGKQARSRRGGLPFPAPSREQRPGTDQ